MTKTEDHDPTTRAVAAIILAAGRSQRMGAFKPLLPFGPSTVVESCIEKLRDGGAETVVVVVAQDARATALRNHLRNANVIFAVNSDPESEMSASIAAGVRALPGSTEAVIINPVDHAAVPAEVVEMLIAEWEQGAPLVKPTWNDRGGHPVLIDMNFGHELLSLDPKLGLKTLFSNYQDQTRRIAVNSNYIARDMDTWDDYRALHLDVFGVLPPKLSLVEPA